MNETASGATSGALSGAGQGAAAGAAFGGWGAVIGGVIGGVVGGLGGGFAGSKAKKATKYARKAVKIQKEREQEAYRQNLLAQIRQARISRASNLAASVAAGIEEGSGSQATLSSIGSQISNVVEYMSVDRNKAVKQAKYMQRAGLNANKAKQIQSITNGLVNLGVGITDAYTAVATPEVKKQQQPQQTNVGVDYGQVYGPWPQYGESYGPYLNR